MSTNSQEGVIVLQNLLGARDGILADFHKRAAEIRVFQDKIKSILPSPLCDHFILANVSRDTLTLHTDSAAWAARLRFKTPDILNCVRENCDIDPPKAIRIKVVPPVNIVAKQKRVPLLSTKNAQLIEDAANSIEDPVLRNALLRLSQHKS